MIQENLKFQFRDAIETKFMAALPVYIPPTIKRDFTADVRDDIRTLKRKYEAEIVMRTVVTVSARHTDSCQLLPRHLL